jgi:hypothetical protein
MGANHIGHFEVGVMSAIIGAGSTMLLGGVISLFVTITFWFVYKSMRNYQYTANLQT